jgi:hypothetical protein
MPPIVGAGAGLGFLAGCAEGCDDKAVPTLLLSAAIGLGSGLGLGAIFERATRDRRVVYRRSPGTLAATIAPLLSPRRKGVAVAVSWR